MEGVPIVTDRGLCLTIILQKYALLVVAAVANMCQDIIMAILWVTPTMSVIIVAQAKCITVINVQPVTAQAVVIIRL